MKKTIFLTINLLLFTVLFSQELAITKSGKIVILYEDGTWKVEKNLNVLLNKSESEQSYSTEPPISDFEILSVYAKWEGGRFRVLGEIKNNGKKAAGVQVEAIARDKNGRLVDSVKFWPNGVENIYPGSTVGVGFTVTYDKRAVKIELKIIGVDVW